MDIQSRLNNVAKLLAGRMLPTTLQGRMHSDYWLAYAVLRYHLFDEIKKLSRNPEKAYDHLIDFWEKQFEETHREEWLPLYLGVMHECLYWLASLEAQASAGKSFLVAPVHESIPSVSVASVTGDMKIRFRGDFIILWSENCVSRTAVIDVKARYDVSDRNAFNRVDEGLRSVAEHYRRMGILFLIATPPSGFSQKREERKLLDIHKWEHREYWWDFWKVYEEDEDLPKRFPMPKNQPLPWLA